MPPPDGRGGPSPGQAGVDLGARLRAARRERGLVIGEVAARSGLSRAYISQVENGKASPSLPAVQRLAAALGVSLARLFVQAEFRLKVTRASDRQVLQFGAHDAPPEQRKLIHLLCAHNRALELVMLEIPVGFSAGPLDPGHEGEEAFYVLQGRVKVVIGDESHVLEEGDSVHWDATVPHMTVNVGDRKAKLIFARTPAGFMDLRFTESVLPAQALGDAEAPVRLASGDA